MTSRGGISRAIKKPRLTIQSIKPEPFLNIKFKLRPKESNYFLRTKPQESTYFSTQTIDKSIETEMQSNTELITGSKSIVSQIENVNKSDNTIINLPLEIIVYILSFINNRDYLNISQTCWENWDLVRNIKSFSATLTQIELEKLDLKCYTITEFAIINYAENQHGSVLIKNILSKCSTDRLTHLNLENCFLTDKTFDIFKLPPNLEYLNLSFNDIKTQGLQKIFNELKKLNTLELEKNNLSDNEIALIVSTSLTSLNLAFNSITDVGIARMITNLPQLLVLDLSNNQLKDESMGSFNSLKLIELKLNGNYITTTGLGNLNMPTLTKLELYKNELNSLNGENIKGLTNLEELDVRNNPFTIPKPKLVDMPPNIKTFKI